jgi:hypothetical protein
MNTLSEKLTPSLPRLSRRRTVPSSPQPPNTHTHQYTLGVLLIRLHYLLLAWPLAPPVPSSAVTSEAGRSRYIIPRCLRLLVILVLPEGSRCGQTTLAARAQPHAVDTPPSSAGPLSGPC